MLTEDLRGILGIAAIVLIPVSLFVFFYFLDQWRMKRMIQKMFDSHPKAEAAPQKVKAAPQPTEPFTLEFHFRNRREEDLEEINRALAKYTLSDLDIVEYKGFLATVTKTDAATGAKTVRHWYGLDDCVLRCTPAKPGEAFHYQISTMTMEKTVWDCAALWRTANPGRTMRAMTELSFADAYAIIVLHHEKLEPAQAPKPVAAVPALSPAAKTPELAKQEPKLEQFGKCGELLTWHIAGNTLFISGSGRLNRCQGDWKGWEREIRNVVIAPGCTAIGKYAFKEHGVLETIQIPDTVRTIGREAFMDCCRLKHIILPDSINGIGHGAFHYCVDLAWVHLPAKLTQISGELFRDCLSLRNLEIPRTVRSIGSDAFNCSGIEYLVTPGLVREIGMDAFCGCRRLISVKLDAGLREIPEGCFRDCGKLASIEIPASVERIGRSAFQGCMGLKGINIPGSVSVIEQEAFFCCSDLMSVSIPDSVTEIGPGAFGYCTKLTDLVIPTSVTKIGNGAFYNVPYVIYRGCAESPNDWGAKSRN